MQDKYIRKIIKLECVVYGSVFNNYYRLQHEWQVHNGKKIKVKHFGAPSNPFDAAKRTKNIYSNIFSK